MYVYYRPPTGWADAFETARLLAPDGLPGDFLGWSTALDGEWGLVGARGDDGPAGPDSGSAYVFSVTELQGTEYCDSLPNSTGMTAAIATAGSSSIGANSLVLVASPVPNGQSGIFFYGDSQASSPFGDGRLCIAPPIFRLPVHASSDRILLHELDLTSPPSSGGPGHIQAGSTWNFQAWFRDPAAGMSGFNLSNANAITFAP